MDDFITGIATLLLSCVYLSDNTLSLVWVHISDINSFFINTACGTQFDVDGIIKEERKLNFNLHIQICCKTVVKRTMVKICLLQLCTKLIMLASYMGILKVLLYIPKLFTATNWWLIENVDKQHYLLIYVVKNPLSEEKVKYFYFIQ